MSSSFMIAGSWKTSSGSSRPIPYLQGASVLLPPVLSLNSLDKCEERICCSTPLAGAQALLNRRYRGGRRAINLHYDASTVVNHASHEAPLHACVEGSLEQTHDSKVHVLPLVEPCKD